MPDLLGYGTSGGDATDQTVTPPRYRARATTTGGAETLKLFTTALLLVTLTTGPQMTASAASRHRTGPCTGSRGFVTHDMPLPVRQAKTKWLLACAVLQWPVPGGLAYARYIAERESHFDPFAKNPYSSASGVMQFVASTWQGLVAAWPRMNHWTGTWVFSARGNVLRAIRVAHETGWQPWS